MKQYITRMTQGFRLRMAMATLVGTVRVGSGFLFVALCKQAVDTATGRTEGELAICVAALIATLVIELLCTSASNRITEVAEADMQDAIRQRLFGRLLTATWAARQTHHTADLLTRLTDDSRMAAECLCRTIPTTITALVQLVGAFLLLWHFSPSLALLLLFLLPAFTLAGKVYFRKVKTLQRRLRHTESRLSEHIQDSLQHRVLLLTYRHTVRTAEVLGALHRSRHHLVRRKTNLTDRSRTAVLAGFEAGYLAAFLWGITGLRNGTVSFGLMTAYLQLAAQIQRPTAQLARLLPQLIQSHTAFSRLADIDRLPVEPEPVSAEQTEDTQPVGIALRNITFAYAEQEPPVFRHFSHTFPPGSHTAIMGITGTGKSTLLRLLLALLQPQEGEMELYSTEDGKRKTTPISAATRSQMVYVPQGNSLLSGTIRQNLLLGKPDATEEEMWEALHTAAADFVADLRDGLDTRCGEHGHRLSEGQAQRIAIARGLLRRGAVLLLDEISASLDEQTETLLMSRLAEARRSHTVLFVTHRSSVLAYCDDTLRLASLERTVLSMSKNRSFYE